MNLKPIKQNMTELELKGGLTVLFSYQTPVACRWEGCWGNAFQYYRTSKFWSKTTSRHINQWIGENKAGEKDQQYFHDLAGEAK